MRMTELRRKADLAVKDLSCSREQINLLSGIPQFTQRHAAPVVIASPDCQRDHAQVFHDHADPRAQKNNQVEGIIVHARHDAGISRTSP